jgi:Mrp family chromosome partitioning ATPase
VFGLPLPRGLSELLQGEALAAEVIQTGPVAGLGVITAGRNTSQAVQALAGDRLGEVLGQLREDYDFIVIDSAPVLPVADSQMIGQQVDSVIFSVMRDVSRLTEVYAAYERLSVLRIHILGAVVNGAEGIGYGSAYHYRTLPEAAEADAPTE